MKISEEARDLFTMPEEYHLAHCISSDFVMGAGIATLFIKYFDMKNILLSKYSLDLWDGHGFCLKEGKVLNLISKQFVYHKPTYQSLKESLLAMRVIAENLCIQKIAIPLIGCGIDGLKWSGVKEVLLEVFQDTDIEFIVCFLENERWRLEE